MLKQLVEDIVEYTKTYSITETEWYWNVNSIRKPNCLNDKEITLEEFERAIREEILYGLVYNNGSALYNQMENDLCNYEVDYLTFQNASKELEKKVQKYIKDFVLKRYDKNGNYKERGENMKEQIFERMIRYGWNLGDNTYKDFSEIFDYHYNNLQNWYEYISGEDYKYTMQDISQSKFNVFVDFMSDFLRAFNEVDKEDKTKVEKAKDYIMNRNIQYDLAGEDLLKILNGESEKE